MKNKLRSLYMLQLVDTELDELRETRGDLPESVRKLEGTVNELQTKIHDCDEALRIGALERTRKEKETLEFIAKIEKYKSQQLQVQSNREYDALTHEMEVAENTITRYEQEIEMFTSEAESITERKEEYATDLASLQSDLAEKQQELEVILAETAEEEKTLLAKREEALAGIIAEDLEMYTRIRNARGKAVAHVRRGSCSGCYNVVPPQKILEIKKHNKMYTCEHCGRILVSEEIAQETRIK